MDTSRMMFNWATDQGMGQGFTQEQVDGKLMEFSCVEVVFPLHYSIITTFKATLNQLIEVMPLDQRPGVKNF